MRSGSRTLAAAAPAAVVIAVAWLRFEQPLGSAPWRAALLLVLALAAAALPGWRLRAGAAVLAAFFALRLALGVWLLPHPVAALTRSGTHFGNGFLDFYATHLPFDPHLHAEMAGVVLVAVFAFALLTALVATTRKPIATALALLAGAGWPATLLGPSHAFAMGAAILAAGLLVVAVLGSRRVPALALPVGTALVLAAVGVGSATAAHGAVHWQSWNPTGGGTPGSVSFVWDAQYGGLDWPRQSTVVLDVRSRTPPSYLRAEVLDDFAGDRWVAGAPRTSDALEPAIAFSQAHETREDVTVEGLSAIHLVGGSVPVRFASGATMDEPEPGFAVVPDGVARGFTYTVWSYAPHPSEAALLNVPPAYPRVLLDDGMLGIGDGIQVPAFGVRGREKEVAAALTSALDLTPYLPLARLAERVTRGARTPYEAVVDLDRWFVVGGGFRYSDHPPIVRPPLVGFVTRTRAGYCQYFAGAMALMLRYLGIPARVAVGFAGPTYDPAGGTWTVTDHDAHAWVEAWFRGYGWLPFDPTPAAAGSRRAVLVHQFTQRVASSQAVSQRSGLPHASKSKSPLPPANTSRLHFAKAHDANIGPPGRGGGFPWVLLLLLLVGGVVGTIALAKEARRLAGRLARDPRRLAAACREELASFLLDQGMEPARSATVRELGELARRQLGVDADAFVAAATAARFGRLAEADAATRTARRELRMLLADCRRYLSRRERLLGLLSLRSLLRVRPAVELWASAGSTGS